MPITDEMHRNMVRASRIDMKARLICLHRQCPNPHPATNLMGLEPSKDDYAAAERWAADIGNAIYAPTPSASSDFLTAYPFP